MTIPKTPFLRSVAVPIGNDDLKIIAENIGIIDKAGIITEATSAHRFDLPFYDNVDLISLSDPKWQPAGVTVYFLRNGDDLIRLDGTSPPLHMINANAPVKINGANVLEYLLFFCFFVRGEEGPFLICEDENNPYIPDSVASSDVSENIEPPQIFGRSLDGHWQVSAIVFYSNALFGSDFSVQPTGMIEMLEDDPILQDLPGKVNAPIKLADPDQ